MRISFDLDDTLICYGPGVPCEPCLPWYLRWLIHDEPLRDGSRELIGELRRRSCEVWIYTTSHRDPWTVKCWLWLHGIRVGNVINQTRHERHNPRSASYYPPSKHPGRFGIHLHVDDSDGVRQEGEEHGFAVVVVAPSDTDWTKRVLEAIERLGSFRPVG